MAIQDDIMSLLRQVGEAGDRATRRGEAGLAILDKLTPRERTILSSSFSPEQYSSLEEAIMFNPLIGGQALDMYLARVGTGAEPDEVTGPSIEAMVGEMTDVVKPSGSRAVPRRKPTPPGRVADTSVTIRELPPVDSMVEDIALDAGVGLPPSRAPRLDPDAYAAMLAEVAAMRRGENTGLSALMQGQVPSLTGPEANQFFQSSDIRRGGSMADRPGSVMGDIRRRIESSIGPIAELPPEKQEMAIRLMETQYRQEAAGRRGATPDAETEAINLGMDVASGVLPAMAALRIARSIPGAAERLAVFLHNRGLMPRTARALERLPDQIDDISAKIGQMKQAYKVRGTEYDPNMFRRGGKVRMLGGGNVRQAMIDRYNRMY